ncbi:hypothetical protein NQ166_04260 [Microbacterium sp. zg.Y1090]|uniref:hypothetical protein n=1 Tax=Microbacterium TaxID=33882 RepID=UPI00214AF170|nr:MULTISPECIES: hypothetical protein [unclassified Microbacterium]MCR2813623.1 hypothetical protein [Microbacterium sp. zg.Y1084]MCR2818044.1 hypothetical protein [Microbacterium sp. zg.Y1090]MDL5486562.1 hypothetical protein [Microbacterium sp. zg-Y1211]WIM27797.1 hypothetical protein QNO26_11655 [Microbacterium sp. zg-Y1090]
MRLQPRTVLSALGVAFTTYLGLGWPWWDGDAANGWVVAAAVALYLATSWLCIFWEPSVFARRTHAPSGEDTGMTTGVSGPTRLPTWVGVLALVSTVVVPALIWTGVAPDARDQLHATWTIGAIGALMVIVVVRRRPFIGFTGILLLAAQSFAWIGPLPALSLGLVGSVMWTATAQLLMWSTDRASRESTQLGELQRAASEWLASQAGRQRERRVQVQRALAVAGPVLTRTIAAGGDLDPQERELARLAEGRLRDELRGRRLLDDDVRGVLEAARQRGANVTVLDEGGLDGLGERGLREVRAQLADVLRNAGSERIYIRTAPHETVAVTVVGRSRSDGEDTVDLWREIELPGRDS